LVHAVLVTLLFAPDVDFSLEILVLGLNLAENDVALVKFVFKLLDPVLVLAHLGCGWPDGRQVGFLLFQFIACLLMLVIKHHQTSKFIKVKKFFILQVSTTAGQV